ncbi:MAG: hypothetical protein ACXACX_03585 [Candidatus Hodarchaeales archaeon]
MITAISAIIYGMHDVIIGFKEQETYFQKENFWANFIKLLQTNRKFLIFSVYTFVWLTIWIINTLSIKLGPIEFPFYFIRENALQRNLPEVSIDALPVYSSYNFIGIGMDFGIFLIFLYLIYVFVRPGIQKMEYLVEYIFKSNTFFTLFIIITGLHLIGHLPFELYGRFGGFESGLVSEPSLGLDPSFTEGWLAFDKITHFLTALLLTLLIIPFLIQQHKYLLPKTLENYRESIVEPNKFIYATALMYLLALGVFWEFAELIMNIIMFQLGAINNEHFNVEFNDALKDLTFDFFGALVGIIINFTESTKE